ncbi:GntR family transcriptional regulator [Streptomyces sp. NBC_01498]|uniref:GntR family transcriptional regulator n=1 Tax=Streptomyces sp. NBC_01498 TaxID=2975870 RepID=UPI002E7B99AF|nr:GntR family transcriptional regulator [Streptomyces sp. NBC_01498]WTL24020.1 GntR family transcriptional regulator [Streptomyces sp. NBC_01498]
MAGSKRGYKEIADELRAQIERGDYRPGQKIPSESALMDEFEAGRETVTKALRLLKDLGLTVSTQGRPATVREFEPIRRTANERLSKQVWGGGASMWSVDVKDAKPTVAGLSVAQIEASPRVAEALGVQRGDPVVLRKRHYVLAGKPVLMSDTYIPGDLASGTPMAEEDTGAGGVYGRLADIGHGPVRFKEEVRTRMPLRAEAALLRLEPGTPVLCVFRSAFDSEGRTVEVNDMVLDGGNYILDYVVDA